MTDLQFRVLLGLFTIVLIAHIVYDPNPAESAKKFDWMKRLKPYQLYLVLAGLLAVVAAGIVGLIGMFFFLRWAAITFLVAAAITEFLRPRKQNAAEKALAYSVVGGELVLIYVIFLGPAQALFK